MYTILYLLGIGIIAFLGYEQSTATYSYLNV